VVLTSKFAFILSFLLLVSPWTPMKDWSARTGLGFYFFLGVPIYPHFRDCATARIAMQKSSKNLRVLLSKFVPHRDCATDGALIGTNLVPLPTLTPMQLIPFPEMDTVGVLTFSAAGNRKYDHIYTACVFYFDVDDPWNCGTVPDSCAI
jgi:hypothetical protein